MAQGYANALWSDQLRAVSAGVERHGLNPNAVASMARDGVDISQHRSKTLDDLDSLAFDVVVTVCDHANESCPLFPGDARRLHHSFEDPPRLAAGLDDAAEIAHIYDRVRDEIKHYVRELGKQLAA